MTAAIDWPRAGRCGGAAVAWSLVVMSVCTASAGGPTVLVRDGAAVATIYVSPVREQPPQRRGRPKVPGPLEAAVEDFNYHVEKMTGARLPVVPVTAVAEVGRPGVLLGSLAAEAGAKPAASDHGDAIRLVVADGLVACGGDTDEASANAAYELLGRLGCEWVMPGEIGEVIPRRATLAIDALDMTHTPSFVVRELWYRGGSRINTPRDYAEFDLWKRRQRLGGRALVPDLGAGHEWDRLIARHREEFARNPEMLALVRDARGNLVRQGPQVESTHPGVAKLIADDIRATFAKNGWPKDRVAAFPVGPADGLGYSVSAESQLAGSGRIDPLVGDPDTTDLVVLLAHAVLEELGAEYPNVELGFYSYSTHAGYPSRVEPDGRINVIFAPINFSRYHGVFDTNSKTRPVYRDVVERWGRRHRETGNRLAYRGYNWNLAENMAPYSMLKMLGDELPWYHAHGVRCINVEATKAWSVNGAHDFLLAKLCWDVDRPWREVLDDYCRAAYGPAAAPMADYLLAITDRQHAAGQEAGSYHALHLIYDLAFVQRMRELIDRATAAAGDGAARERVSFAMLPLEALRLYLEFHAAASRLDFPAAQRGYDAMIAHWQASYDRNSQLVGKEVPRYLERYIAQFVTQGLAHATGDYRIVTPLPDRLPTAFDPHDVGAATNLAGPDINDGLFVTTRTFSAPWDAQGLGLLRSGAVWYRFAFEPAGPAAGEGLGLFVGGVDDEVEVWLNGTRIGASGVGFSKPFVFDLTGPLLPGERNLLALKVVRNSAANEIGLGGIIRPCFLFAGPRLAQPAPHPEEKQRRVLPGGELGAGE